MKVSEIMTRDVVTVRVDTPIREVARILAQHQISGVPVCSADGRLAGVVTEYDLIAKPQARTAGDAMERNVISVMEDTDVEDVRYLLVERKIRRVPVVRDHQVIGIVSRSDLVREMALGWVCESCGELARAERPPESCPKCGTRRGFDPARVPPGGVD
jgi:CBS domain-containing protein